jgi:hypothetical protein
MSPNSILPDAAREAAWSALWLRLLQPVPDNSPASVPKEEPDDEMIAAVEDTAA